MIGFAQPEARIGWRIEAKDAADLFDAVEPLAATPLDTAALSRQQQAGDRRIAQVDDKVPAGADGHQPQVQPVAVMLALFQNDDALDVRRFGQQRHDDLAADHGDAGIVMVVDQVCEQPARQDEIADPAVADEQNTQIVPPDAQWPTIAVRSPRAKKPPCQRLVISIREGCLIISGSGGASPMSKNYVTLASRGILAIDGPDRATFLQGLVSNDVTQAGPSRAIYSAFLTAQGKYLHDFFIAETGERLLLDCEAERLPDLQRRLKMYKLRSKIALEDVSAQFSVTALFGPGALEALGLPAEPGAAAPFGASL